MINKKFFFDHVRITLFGGVLKQSQIDGLNSILDEWENKELNDIRHLAYMLATCHHETDRTIKPIVEYGKGKGRKYGQRLKMNGKPYTDTKNIFYGRGFVQLTWYENYKKAGDILGIDFISFPEKTLDLNIATRIMFEGMMDGWFTGKKLSDYFNKSKEDWLNARRIINGTDKASLISDYAHKYYAAISFK